MLVGEVARFLLGMSMSLLGCLRQQLCPPLGTPRYLGSPSRDVAELPGLPDVAVLVPPSDGDQDAAQQAQSRVVCNVHLGGQWYQLPPVQPQGVDQVHASNYHLGTRVSHTWHLHRPGGDLGQRQRQLLVATGTQGHMSVDHGWGAGGLATQPWNWSST